MKRTLAFFLPAFCASVLGCAESATQSAPSQPKINGKYLLAHGFQQKWKETDPDIYDLETARLSDVLRDLGLSVEDLQPTVNRPGFFDWRDALREGMYVRVEPHDRDPSGKSFGKSGSPCTVRVWLNEPPPQAYLKTESSPRMRVQSVKALQDPSKPLQITFELAAEGKTPLVLDSRGQFWIHLTTIGHSPQTVRAILASFPKGTPDRISVSPERPIMLSVSATDEGANPVTHGPWTSLRPGQYVVAVRIAHFKKGGPYFDYQWVGSKFSDEYTFSLK